VTGKNQVRKEPRLLISSSLTGLVRKPMKKPRISYESRKEGKLSAKQERRRFLQYGETSDTAFEKKTGKKKRYCFYKLI